MATDKELIDKQARLERIKRAAREQAELDRPAPEILIRQAATIPSEKLQTVFGGRLVRGAFQLLVGPGEAGKGMCSTDIIARLSTGHPFPGEGGKYRTPMVTVVCVTEDSASRVKARLEAAEADLTKVYFVDGPPSMRGGLIVPSPIAFDADAGALLDKIRSVNASSLFLETTLEHLGDREGKRSWSTNNEAEVRRALAPIVQVCREGNIIGWGVMHPRKSQDGGIADSISGSAAFNNVGRTVLQVYKDPEDDSKSPWRLLITSKANYLATKPTTLKFHVESWSKDRDEGRVVWGTEGHSLVDPRTAEDIWRQIREKNHKRKDYTTRDAENMLSELLATGIKTIEEVKATAEDQDLSWRTVQKAKDNLGVESVKSGFPAKVTGWRLPPKKKDDM